MTVHNQKTKRAGRPAKVTKGEETTMPRTKRKYTKHATAAATSRTKASTGVTPQDVISYIASGNVKPLLAQQAEITRLMQTKAEELARINDLIKLMGGSVTVGSVAEVTYASDAAVAADAPKRGRKPKAKVVKDDDDAVEVKPKGRPGRKPKSAAAKNDDDDFDDNDDFEISKTDAPADDDEDAETFLTSGDDDDDDESFDLDDDE